jgi:cytochrome c-type biogenesis protein CcmH/NrfF
LWFGPPLVLLVGLVMLMRTVRERRKRIEREPLSASEHAEAEHLLSGDGEGERK